MTSVKMEKIDNMEIPETFKSSLPPRKRARTQEEKEQRRIERIMRNRRAARQSRERKRKYMETLENKLKLYQDIFNNIDMSNVLSDKPDLLKKYNSLKNHDINEMDEEDEDIDVKIENTNSDDDHSSSYISSTNSLNPLFDNDSASNNNTDFDDIFNKNSSMNDSNILLGTPTSSIHSDDGINEKKFNNLQMQWFNEPLTPPESTVSLDLFSSPIDWEILRNPAVFLIIA